MVELLVIAALLLVWAGVGYFFGEAEGYAACARAHPEHHEVAAWLPVPVWLHELPRFVRRRAWDKGIAPPVEKPFPPWPGIL